MKILQIEIPAFGGIEGLETGPEDLPGLVVVEGENEAGKSTFFEAVATLLYGFLPATRDGNPFSPWGPGDAEVRARIGLSDGSGGEVHRRLLATPRGSWTTGAVQQDLRNQPLPFTTHLPRRVYGQAFALTLAELASLEGDTWSEIQDRLIGGMGARDLTSIREVVADLDGAAAELWRPDRRGKPTSRLLRDRLTELRKLRRVAVDEEREVRETVRELATLEEERRQVRQDRAEMQARLKRHAELVPARDDLARLAALAGQAGDAEALEGLPEAPRAELERMSRQEAELEDRLGQISQGRAEPERAAAALTDAHRALLARAAEIEALAARAVVASAVGTRVQELERELADAEAEIGNQIRRVADREPEPSVLEASLEISLTRLEQAVNGVREAETALEEASQSEAAAREAQTLAAESRANRDVASGDTSSAAPSGPGPVLPLWLPIAALLLAVLSVLAWLAVRDSVLLVAPVVFAAAALFLMGQRNQGLRSAAAEAARRSREREEEEKELGALRARVDLAARERASREEALARARSSYLEVLAPLDPGPGAASPSPELVIRVEQLQEQLRRRAGRAARIEEERAALSDFALAAEGLRDLLPETGAGLDPESTARLLQAALEEARQVERDAERATARLRQLEEDEQEVAASLNRMRAERDAIDAALRALGDGDPGAGLAEVEARLEARAAHRALRRELLARHGDLDALHDRLRAFREEGEELTDEEVAALEVEQTELGEASERLTGQVRALEERMDHLGQRTRLDALDGDMEAVEAELHDSLRRRDRLWLLARIVQQAERTIREAHQPQVLRDAGTRLAALTRGRYDALVLGGEDGRSFRVQGPASPESRPIERPLSTGTREQIYTALRLAIVDQLDQAGERLPLLLDEVMVNWDDARREAGMDLLAEIARTRQCFFFTCHPFMAESLARRGARRIRLPSPETA